MESFGGMLEKWAPIVSDSRLAQDAAMFVAIPVMDSLWSAINSLVTIAAFFFLIFAVARAFSQGFYGAWRMVMAAVVALILLMPKSVELSSDSLLRHEYMDVQMQNRSAAIGGNSSATYEIPFGVYLIVGTLNVVENLLYGAVDRGFEAVGDGTTGRIDILMALDTQHNQMSQQPEFARIQQDYRTLCGGATRGDLLNGDKVDTKKWRTVGLGGGGVIGAQIVVEESDLDFFDRVKGFFGFERPTDLSPSQDALDALSKYGRPPIKYQAMNGANGYRIPASGYWINRVKGVEAKPEYLSVRPNMSLANPEFTRPRGENEPPFSPEADHPYWDEFYPEDCLEMYKITEMAQREMLAALRATDTNTNPASQYMTQMNALRTQGKVIDELEASKGSMAKFTGPGGRESMSVMELMTQGAENIALWLIGLLGDLVVGFMGLMIGPAIAMMAGGFAMAGALAMILMPLAGVVSLATGSLKFFEEITRGLAMCKLTLWVVYLALKFGAALVGVITEQAAAASLAESNVVYALLPLMAASKFTVVALALYGAPKLAYMLAFSETRPLAEMGHTISGFATKMSQAVAKPAVEAASKAASMAATAVGGPKAGMVAGGLVKGVGGAVTGGGTAGGGGSSKVDSSTKSFTTVRMGEGSVQVHNYQKGEGPSKGADAGGPAPSGPPAGRPTP